MKSLEVLTKHWQKSTLWVLLPVMLLLSLNSSISGDEDVTYAYGKKVLNFFISGGTNKDYLKTIRGPDYAFNNTFDLIIEALNRIFSFQDIHMVRHLVNAFLGWLTLLTVYLLGRRYFNKNIGFLSALILFLSPRFLGHSLNNPKDIPFALGYIVSIYWIFRFLEKLNKPNLKTSLFVGLAIAIPLNVRIGGFILIPFLIFLSYSYLFLSKEPKDFFDLKGNRKSYLAILIHSVFIFIIAYVLMLVFWPYALESPLLNPYKAYTIFLDYHMSIKQLFEGKNIFSKDIPNYYTLKWISISTPLIFLIGLALSTAYFKVKNKQKLILICLYSFGVYLCKRF